MATIRKRNGKWQVQIRHLGYPPMSKTFGLKSDAIHWASNQERAFELGAPLKPPPKKVHTLAQLLDDYEARVLPFKKAAAAEKYMLRVLRRDPMSGKPLTTLSAEDIARFRDRRLGVTSAATVVRHLSVLRHALRIAEEEWGWASAVNEMRRVKMPRLSVGHIERIPQEDIKAVLAIADNLRGGVLSAAVRLALSTGMRRGEILRLQWPDLDLARSRLIVKTSKNGRARTIPLSPETVVWLRSIKKEDGPVVPTSENALKLAFGRTLKKAGVRFRFHDLRHEAISRFFEAGLTMPEVRSISGHQTLSQLSRYAHADLASVSSKLSRIAMGICTPVGGA